MFAGLFNKLSSKFVGVCVIDDEFLFSGKKCRTVCDCDGFSLFWFSLFDCGGDDGCGKGDEEDDKKKRYKEAFFFII
jgi:hypothetical protein